MAEDPSINALSKLFILISCFFRRGIEDEPSPEADECGRSAGGSGGEENSGRREEESAGNGSKSGRSQHKRALRRKRQQLWRGRQNSPIPMHKSRLVLLEHCRMTPLLGPPGAWKTTLLLSLAGKLDSSVKVRALSLRLRYSSVSTLFIHPILFHSFLQNH